MVLAAYPQCHRHISTLYINLPHPSGCNYFCCRYKGYLVVATRPTEMSHILTEPALQPEASREALALKASLVMGAQWPAREATCFTSCLSLALEEEGALSPMAASSVSFTIHKWIVPSLPPLETSQSMRLWLVKCQSPISRDCCMDICRAIGFWLLKDPLVSHSVNPQGFWLIVVNPKGLQVSLVNP